MIYVDYKDLAKRTASGKGLYDKAFEITNNPECDRYQKEFLSMVHMLGFFLWKIKRKSDYQSISKNDERIKS